MPSANRPDVPTSSTSSLAACPICDTPLTANDLTLSRPLAFIHGLVRGQCLRCTLEALELLPDTEGMDAAMDMELLSNVDTQDDISFSLLD